MGIELNNFNANNIYNMAHKYLYNLKVYECSIPKCDDYKLQYYYFYIFRSKDKIDLIYDDDYIIESNFKYNDYFYLIFWVKKNKKYFKTTKKIDLDIGYYLIKTEDSYMIRKNEGKTIKDIIQQQYCDISYIKYKIPNILSTVWLNLITSNKILYQQFFIEEKIIKNSYITTFENAKKIDTKKYVLKTPYSSASYCVTQYNRQLPKECYTEEGIIVQKINKSLKDIELKLHVFNGKIMYGNIKNYNIDVDTIDQELNVISKNKKILQPIITKHKKDIRELCDKVFFKMNEFVACMKYKLLCEYKNFIIPLKLDKKIFMSFFTQKKLKTLENLKKSNKNNKNNKLIDEYIEYINVEPSVIMKQMPQINDVMDLYMRIDLMMPDNENYKTVSLLEIEPFASGKGYILNIKDAININFIDITPSSSQSTVFTKYIQELLKNKYSNRLEFIPLS